MKAGVIARRPLALRAADAAISTSSGWPRDRFVPRADRLAIAFALLILVAGALPEARWFV